MQKTTGIFETERMFGRAKFAGRFQPVNRRNRHTRDNRCEHHRLTVVPA
ncbi:hypothetical protein RE6C_00684 [Rhodopirellula europaea 6C]|uniref:Uncharacterized protein n=1 Tax=Rhodopirellula europaea 6C TaxID=1263867 RepID=M2B102_9BACT|nr:hypothetical protein RE6C_00684 [Rhodopirellula europaea 6C]